MSSKEFEADIKTTVGGRHVTVRVFANDRFQAEKIIKTRPDFKSFWSQVREVR